MIIYVNPRIKLLKKQHNKNNNNDYNNNNNNNNKISNMMDGTKFKITSFGIGWT